VGSRCHSQTEAERDAFVGEARADARERVVAPQRFPWRNIPVREGAGIALVALVALRPRRPRRALRPGLTPRDRCLAREAVVARWVDQPQLAIL
jgi:hypothetical protein